MLDNPLQNCTYLYRSEKCDRFVSRFKLKEDTVEENFDKTEQFDKSSILYAYWGKRIVHPTAKIMLDYSTVSESGKCFKNEEIYKYL